MKNRHAKLPLPFVVLLTLASTSTFFTFGAAAQDFGVGGRIGTTGYGGEVGLGLGERIGVRAAVGLGSFDVDFDSEVVTYEGEVEMQNVLAVVDLFPTGGGFRVSAGAMFNDNRLRGDAPILDILLDNGIELPPSLVPLPPGSVHAEASVDEVAPYLGIGFGRGPRREGGFHASLDLGVAYHGEPDVRLELRELPFPLSDIPGGQAVVDQVLAAEERDLEEELEEYRYFPVVALTLGYRF